MKTQRSRKTLALALRIALTGGLGLALAAGSPAVLAQTGTKAADSDATPPKPQPPRPVRFPAFSQKSLGNGLTVVVIEHHEQPVVSLRLITRAGQLYEPADKAGLAQLTATLLTEGTESRSSQQIAQAIDEVGGSLGAGIDADAAYASAFVTSDQLDLGLDLLSDIVLRPSFPAEELERQRRQALGNLQVQQESPSYLADAAFVRTLYGLHPYGQPGLGTPETLSGLVRDDLVAFHRSHYVPNESILAVVGDVKPADALARVEKAFGAWKRGEAAKAPAFSTPKREGRKLVVIDKPDAVQTEIRVGDVGLAFTDPDYFTAQVYDSVLGASPASRLFDEVRRKAGLAYGAGSAFGGQQQPGSWRASTSTKTESTVEALGIILDVLHGLEEKPVPADELGRRKTYLSGAFPLEIETPDGIATEVLQAMFFGYGKDYLESYRDKIDAVTPSQLESFAKQRIHLDKATVVLVGNAQTFLPALEKRFGKAEVIPYREVDLRQADLRRAKEPGAAPAAAK